jgi:hypothetical protein
MICVEEPQMTSDKQDVQVAAERIKTSWIVGLFLWTAAAVGTTWTIAEKVALNPRDVQITQLQAQIAELKSKASAPSVVTSTADPIVLHDTQVMEKESVTTSDGNCQIRVDSIIGDSVRLVVTVGSDEPITTAYIDTGKRQRVGPYYIDIHKIAGNWVYLSVVKPPVH